MEFLGIGVRPPRCAASQSSVGPSRSRRAESGESTFALAVLGAPVDVEDIYGDLRGREQSVAVAAEAAVARLHVVDERIVVLQPGGHIRRGGGGDCCGGHGRLPGDGADEM
jgi:hypothetical protein